MNNETENAGAASTSPPLAAGVRVEHKYGLGTVIETLPTGVRMKFDVAPPELDGDIEDIVYHDDLRPLPAPPASSVAFKTRAALGIKYGIPVIPLRGKAPFMAGWQNAASIDPGQIDKWNDQYPDANCGLVAKSVNGGHWCFEVDSPDVAKRYKAETGEELPSNTLMVASRPGRGHRWFIHNAASIAMGNVSQSDTAAGDFSVRANNEQAVAPGSIHPESGKPYRLVNDVPPVEAPAKLIEWLLKQKKSTSSAPRTLSLKGERIPRGQHDSFLTQVAGKLRSVDMEEGSISAALIETCENRCDNYGSDYVEMCEKIAKSICRYAPGQAPTVLIGGKVPGTAAAPFASLPALPVQTANIHIPIDDAMFHGLAGGIIRKLSPNTESHPVGNLLELLAVFGNVVGPTAYFQVEDSLHYANIFVVKVGKSSKSRKGTGRARIMKIAQALDLPWYCNRITSGLGSGEIIVHEVRDAVSGPVTDKKTGQLRIELLDPGIDDKRLFVNEGEFAGILAVAGRKDCLLSKNIRDAWDHLPIRNKSKSSSAVCMNPHISISADITREELSVQLKDADRFNGFGNRFLWPFVERQALLPHGGEEIDWSEEIVELRKAVKFAQSQKRIFMDRNARQMWERMYDDLSEDNIPGVIGAVTSRAEAQVVRLALIFALLDLADHISTDHLKAARALWNYCEDSARIIFGGVTKGHQRILEFMGKEMKTVAEIRDVLFSRNRRNEEIKRDLDTLLALGRIVSIVGDDGTERFGLPR